MGKFEKVIDKLQWEFQKYLIMVEKNFVIFGDITLKDGIKKIGLERVGCEGIREKIAEYIITFY